MRRILIATLALSPAMLYAQAILPAQPQTATTAPALQSKLVTPALLGEPAAADHGTTPSVRVSTGVVIPKLIFSIDIPSEPNVHWRMAGRYRSAVVEMVVDQTGKPSELKLVQSAGEDLDKSVLSAVSQYRFRPATVDSIPVPMTVALTVNIQNPLL
jgi:TonB family protein